MSTVKSAMTNNNNWNYTSRDLVFSSLILIKIQLAPKFY